jgi:hypothetical protein
MTPPKKIVVSLVALLTLGNKEKQENVKKKKRCKICSRYIKIHISCRRHLFKHEFEIECLKDLSSTSIKDEFFLTGFLIDDQFFDINLK